MKLLFGFEEFQVSTPKNAKLTLKSHYPAIFFVVAGVGLAAWTSYINHKRLSEEQLELWNISGQIAVPPEVGQPDFRRGDMMFRPAPSNFQPGVGMDGRFSSFVENPKSKTFEEVFDSIYYRIEIDGSVYFFEIKTKNELKALEADPESSLLEGDSDSARVYKPIELKRGPATGSPI